MSLNEEITALRNIPMFANMEMTQLKLLAFTSQRLDFKPGQDIFCYGEEGDAAYIILDGSADVVVAPDGTEMTVATVGANELIGEIAILCDVPRTATVRAKTELCALRIPKDLFLRMAKDFPDMAVQIMSDLATRLHHTTEKLAEALSQGNKHHD